MTNRKLLLFLRKEKKMVEAIYICCVASTACQSTHLVAILKSAAAALLPKIHVAVVIKCVGIYEQVFTHSPAMHRRINVAQALNGLLKYSRNFIYYSYFIINNLDFET